MASSIVFINGKGEILIYRRYREDVSRAEVQQFCSKIVATKEVKEQPITLLDDVSFVHTTQGDITLVATTKSNSNVALLMQFLLQIITLCKAYFNGVFDENTVRDNFVLIYELLDEIMDYGYPQITDTDLLKEYITQGEQKLDLTNAEKLKQITIRATGAISWRPENLRYTNNVAYIDVIESVNVLISTRDTLLKTDVQGQVMMKTQLSGMPECKLGINDKLIIKVQDQDPTSAVTSSK
jgi:AP-2 complex subunit mu-1